MAIDLKQGIDIKQLGPLIKGLFAKDSNVFGNKLVVFSVISIVVSMFLIYGIYGISDNQLVYDESKNKYNTATVKLDQLDKKFKKTVARNKNYFEQLTTAPKNKSELSAEITGLVSQYNLQLNSVDLNAKVGKQKGVNLMVSGSYLNLIRFSSEMNKILAASKLINLSVKKSRKGNNLIMELDIVFAAPPPASTLPKQTKDTVVLFKINNLFAKIFNVFISSANASEGDLPEILPTDELSNLPPLEAEGLSLFQKAYAQAKLDKLTKFAFTNKAGETKLYLTGLQKSDEALVAHHEAEETQLPEILPTDELSNLPPLVAQSTKKIEKLVDIKSQKVDVAQVTNLSVDEAKSAILAKKIADMKAKKIAVKEVKILLPSETMPNKPTKNIVKNKFKKAKPLDDFQRAYVDALVQGQRLFEFTDVKGITSTYRTDEEGFKLAGFVENDPSTLKDSKKAPKKKQLSDTGSLRDPFAVPGTSGSAKINRGSSSMSSEEEQYYLSGVLTSETSELCVIITPIGESKILHVGDKVNEEVTITGIYSNAIMINGSSKKILIGDEIL